MRRLSAAFAFLMIASFVLSPKLASANSLEAPRTYTVRRGDTLAKIAARQGLSSWQSLYAANRSRIRNPDVIRVGQVLALPGTTRAAAPARPRQVARPAPRSRNDSMTEIITAAARRYGQSPTAMLRVARCESTLNPRAYNRSSRASGLFQFLPSTWRTTPYRNQSIFDPYASANAAAWMWSVGRRNEWVCQ